MRRDDEQSSPNCDHFTIAGRGDPVAFFSVLAIMRDPDGFEDHEEIADMDFPTEEEAAAYADWLGELMCCTAEMVEA